MWILPPGIAHSDLRQNSPQTTNHQFRKTMHNVYHLYLGHYQMLRTSCYYVCVNCPQLFRYTYQSSEHNHLQSHQHEKTHTEPMQFLPRTCPCRYGALCHELLSWHEVCPVLSTDSLQDHQSQSRMLPSHGRNPQSHRCVSGRQSIHLHP